jgi:hypothetical protein
VIPPLLNACSNGVAEPWIARYSCAIHFKVGHLVVNWFYLTCVHTWENIYLPPPTRDVCCGLDTTFEVLLKFVLRAARGIDLLLKCLNGVAKIRTIIVK